MPKDFEPKPVSLGDLLNPPDISIPDEFPEGKTENEENYFSQVGHTLSELAGDFYRSWKEGDLPGMFGAEQIGDALKDQYAHVLDRSRNIVEYGVNSVPLFGPIFDKAISDWGTNMVAPELPGGPQTSAADLTTGILLPILAEKLPGMLKRGPKAAPGSEFTDYRKTYAEAADTKLPSRLQDVTPAGTGNNLWVRDTNAPTNKGRTLMVQFSNEILNPRGDVVNPSDVYYDKLYSTRAGFDRAADFWEVPQWQAQLAHNLKNVDSYVVRDPAEAVKFLNSAKYDTVAFSALDVNKNLIKEIAQNYGGNIAVGGYGDLKGFEGLKNVKVYKNMKDFVESKGAPFAEGFDYRLFKGTKNIPRLQLSDGCTHSCAFCAVPKEITEVPKEKVLQQARALAKDLPSKLVYLNDKTFGQAKNYTMLPEIYAEMKKINPDFDGFIIQTTAAQMKKLTPEFLKKAGIKHVELGIESYNDPILRAHKKPANQKIIDHAAGVLREAGVSLIPNIMVGLPGETPATYAQTLKWLRDNKDIISHVNVNNLAIYEEAALGKSGKFTPKTAADLNENVAAKSWQENPQLHSRAYGGFSRYGSSQLNRVPFEGVKVPIPTLSDLLNPPQVTR